MGRLCAGLCTILLLASCSTKITIPRGASIVYENDLVGVQVPISGALARVVLTKLATTPDRAYRGEEMPLNTRKYLRIGDRTFQVQANELVLLDDWGIRIWLVSKIESDLDALLGKTPIK